MKEAEEASAKYRVGTATSVTRIPVLINWAMISWSKMNLSELVSRFTDSSASRLKALYPVWYSDSRSPKAMFSSHVRNRFETYFHQGIPCFIGLEPSSREPSTTSAFPFWMGSMMLGNSVGSYW